MTLLRKAVRAVAGLVSLYACTLGSGYVWSVENQFSVNKERGANWHLLHSYDQMQVYSKPAGERIRYRVEMQLRGNLTSLVALLKDTDRRSQWDHRVHSVDVLKRQSQMRQLLYVVLDAPWPDPDREMVLQEQWFQDPLSYDVRLVQRMIPNYLQPVGSRLPVDHWYSEWVLTPVARRAVDLVVEIETNWQLAPHWMADYFGQDAMKVALLAYSRESIAVYDDQVVAFVNDPYHYVPRIDQVTDRRSNQMLVNRAADQDSTY